MLDGRRADIAMDGSAEQVVQDAKTQCAADGVDAFHVELAERGTHDGETAGEDLCAPGLESGEAESPDVAAPTIRLRSRTSPSGVMPP